MGIDFATQGQVTGKLSALQEVVLILSLGPIGAIADRIGRKPVYVFGLLATALGFALYPFAQTVGQLAGFRIIVAIGGAAMIGMMVTVIADYTQNSTRGHANGLQGFVATLGAFIPPLLAELTAYYVAQGVNELAAQKFTFGLAGSMGVLGALIALIGLSPNAGRIAKGVRTKFSEIGHLEERVLGASIEANFIVGSQVRLHRVTHACPQAYFGMILARISGGIRILNRIRLWAVVAHGKRGGGSCSLGWPW